MKIPALDVTLLMSSGLVLATGFARDALVRSQSHASGSSGGSDPLVAMASSVLVIPIAFVAYVLWKGAPVRATGWRRVAARVTAVLLWIVALVTSLAGVGLPIPSALSLSALSAMVSSVALAALSAAVWLTSPARQGVTRRRSK